MIMDALCLSDLRGRLILIKGIAGRYQKLLMNFWHEMEMELQILRKTVEKVEWL